MFNQIEQNEGAYHAKRFDKDLSTVFIDSILYSNDYLRAVFFAITRDSNETLLTVSNKDGYHYNARVFIASRSSTAGEWNVKWFRIMNINRYSNYTDISELVRTSYFVDLASIRNENGESRYKYNVNDIRFWDGPVWDEGAQMLEQHFSGRMED